MHKENLIDKDLYEVHDGEKIWSKLKGRYLKGTINSDGYLQTSLKCIDGKNRIFRFNRIIWYLLNGEIPNNKIVNHIDENKQNNHISNLNLMTPKENTNWGTGIKRQAEKMRGRAFSEEHKRKLSEIKKGVLNGNRSKPVIALDSDGNVVKEYPSAAEAGRQLGVNYNNICLCCYGLRKTCGGYGWRHP